MAKLISTPMLLKGRVMHARSLPKVNKFEYKNLYLYLPLKLKNSIRVGWLSFNKFNLFSFFDVDHFILDSKSQNTDHDCLSQIKQILEQNRINNIEDIILVCHPRILGYAFNPASFWLCFDREENLLAVLVEVSNTFGQKHSYLLFNSSLDPIDSKQWLTAKKEFHVSPFYDVEGDYKFRFVVEEGKLDFYINYYIVNQLHLSTYLKCSYQELNAKNLFLSFIKMPLLTFKTISLIHLQALKLWLFKQVKYYPLAKKLPHNLTVPVHAPKQNL